MYSKSHAPAAKACEKVGLPAERAESELVERAAKGDRAAFGELAQRIERLVRGVAGRQFHFSQPDSQDLAQDVLLALMDDSFRLLRSYRGESSLGTWLSAMARHRCLDQLRRMAAQRNLSGREGSCRPGFACSADDRIALREAVSQLSIRDQILVHLFFLDGRSYRDIAQTLHLPEGTLASRLFRARAQIKGILNIPPRRGRKQPAAAPIQLRVI